MNPTSAPIPVSSSSSTDSAEEPPNDSQELDMTLVARARTDIDKDKDNALSHYQNPSHIECARSMVLRNHELLEIVMSFMVVPNSNGEEFMVKPHTTHLLWASLTCRNFFDPAMNILWKSMTSWTPILPLITTSMTGPDPLGENNFKHLTTTEPIFEHHLETLDSYVQRIRNFRITRLDVMVSPHIHTSLAKLRQFELFPALRKLEIPSLYSIRPADIPSLFLTPSPTLSAVSIHGIMAPVQIYAASLLHDISAKSSDVRMITLEGGLDSQCINALCGFSRLKTLHLNFILENLSTDALKVLSTLKSLKRLSIIMGKFSVFVLSQPNVTKLPFGSLKTLLITGPATPTLNILQRITVKDLRQVHLHFLCRGIDKTAASKCVATLAELGKDILRDIKITSDGVLSPILRKDLRCLLDFSTQLESVELDVTSMTKETLDRLASSKNLQNLKTLKIVSGYAPTEEELTFPQVSGLASFASSLNSLEDLTVPMVLGLDEHNVQAMQKAVAETARKYHPLETLKLIPLGNGKRNRFLQAETSIVTNATTLNAYVLARYLDHFFPCLKSLEAQSFQDLDPSWCKAVTSLLQEFRNERQRAQEADDPFI